MSGATGQWLTALYRTDADFRRFLGKLPMAAYTTDAEGLITYYNSHAVELWGRAPRLNDPIDRFCGSFRLFSPDGAAIAHEQCWMALALCDDQEYYGQEIIIERPQGDRRTALAHASPLHDELGELCGAINMLTDISDRQQTDQLRGLLASIVDSSDDAIISKTAEGVITSWNLGAERLYGYTAEEAVGQPVSLILPPDRTEELTSLLARLKRGEWIQHFETVRVRKDGTRIEVSDTLSPLRDSQGRVIGASAISRGISERKREERRRTVQRAVTDVLAHTDPVQESAGDLLQAICESLGWGVAALWTVDQTAGALRCAEFWHARSAPVPEFEAATRQRIFPAEVGLPGRVWATGKPLWIPEVAEDDNFPRCAVAARDGLHTAFGCPILLGKETLGIIEFYSREPQPQDDDLLMLMASIGSQIGQAIDRKRAEAQLRRSERELADFFANGAVGMHWVGPDGTILRVNQAELDLLGYAEHEYLGHHISGFYVDQGVIEQILYRLQSGEELRGCEAQMRCKDGSIKHVLIDSNVLWEDGEFIHTRCFTRDITDQKRAEDALREAHRRKDEFLAMLAHELRNPLAPLRSGLDLLSLEQSGGCETIELMQQQVEHLVRLVDDLLDVSRIVRGKVRIRKESVDLATVVQRCVRTLDGAIRERSHRLSVILPDEPVWLDADPVRLAQVIENLLSNACKYTDPGGRIELSIQQQSGSAVLRLRDDGVGIEPDLLPQVFDLFSQASRSLDRSQGGLGIGLTLVKSLVELHRGTVSAASDGPGKGSEFTVRLPVARAKPTTGAVRSNSSPSTGGRILLVDDNVGAARMLSRLLTKLGAGEIECVHDGLAVLEKIREFQPQLVLLDIGLPGMDGYQIGKKLRQSCDFDHILLVALTGYGQEEDRRKSKEAGFDEHLVKPPAVAQLQRLLDRLK